MFEDTAAGAGWEGCGTLRRWHLSGGSGSWVGVEDATKTEQLRRAASEVRFLQREPREPSLSATWETGFRTVYGSSNPWTLESFL